jgi:hypothetical protein
MPDMMMVLEMRVVFDEGEEMDLDECKERRLLMGIFIELVSRSSCIC